MALKRWTFQVATEDEGLRLDQLVAKHTDLSRRQAREALQQGGVQVARKRVRVAGKLLKAGTEVLVAFDESLGPVPDAEVPAVFEDRWLLAVNKPAGIPSQGTWASDRHDVLAILKARRPDLKHVFIQHRLDQGTSGLLLFSKDPAANAGLTKQFTEHSLRKTYLARASAPLAAAVQVDRPIGRLRGAAPGRFDVEGDLMDPKSARTDFRPAAPEEAAALVPGHWIVAEPATGRTHQIRVHAAALGLPLLGDTLYGGAPSDRLWLHAWKLALTHPVTGEALELVAPPDRFRREAP